MEDAFRELVNKEFEIREDIAELQDGDFSIPQMQEFNERIKGKQETLHKRIKNLKLRAEEENSEKIKLHILERLKIHEKEFDDLRVSLRKANLVSKRNLEKRYDKERNSLMEGGEEALRLQKERAREDVVRTAKNITEALKRTRANMTAEVERSVATVTELEEDLDVIKSTIQTHKSFSTYARQGRMLLNKLKARDVTDKFLIFFGVLVFLLVVLYTIKIRLKFTLFSWLLGEG